MITVSRELSERINRLLDDALEILPYEMRSIVGTLKTQLEDLRCEDGLLNEVIAFLQEYDRFPSVKREEGVERVPEAPDEKNGKIRELTVLLLTLRLQNEQAFRIKRRR